MQITQEQYLKLVKALSWCRDHAYKIANDSDTEKDLLDGLADIARHAAIVLDEDLQKVREMA